MNCCIPSLLIQPLVENAIVHGIQPCKGKGVVTISVAECGNRVRIAVRDTGHGIDPKVIERVEANEMPGNKIGLLNVHHRVKLLYGEGCISAAWNQERKLRFTFLTNAPQSPHRLRYCFEPE